MMSGDSLRISSLPSKLRPPDCDGADCTLVSSTLLSLWAPIIFSSISALVGFNSVSNMSEEITGDSKASFY